VNLGELAIRKSVITWVLTLVVLVVGFQSFNRLSRLEDPEFVIKQAVVTTPYPGASAREVQLEVTEVIEKAVQQLGQLKYVDSYSERGFSKVSVIINDSYDKSELPQVWDELRRKVNDAQAELPPGAGPSRVIDDFGDVYGVYYALHGEGFTYAELKKVAELIRRELVTVTDVQKVVLSGVQRETIYVEISRNRAASLGISMQSIFDALSAKNLPADAGRIKIGPEYVAIHPSGEFRSYEDFGDLLIGSNEGRLIYLRDVATIRRDYVDPPSQILRFNGEPSIGIAISTISGGNAVTMGQAVQKRLDEITDRIPHGMELGVISMQSDTVVESINGFLVNLAEAVAIVVVVLLFAMGLRSGLIIGFILVLTISATFIFMALNGVALQRISLGALIIALGMLVDNAIVVVDGMKVKMEEGMDGLQAAREVVGQQSVPLAGATAVAVLAFASIGTMQNGTGEYCRSLYQVILYSLSLSWLTAVTTTALLTKEFVLPRGGAKAKGEGKDPYDSPFFRTYRGLLVASIRARWITVAVVVVLFVLAMVGFGHVENLFFPPSTRPQLIVEIQFREGTHIRDTEASVGRIEEHLRGFEGVTDIASSIGGGHSRFLLTYDVPVDASTNYASVLVGVEEYAVIPRVDQRIQREVEEMFPDANVNVKKFGLGPGNGGKIQLRIYGPDRARLRELAETAKAVLRADPDSKSVRDEWGDKTKVLRPELADDRARRLGISRPTIAQALQSAFSGTVTGVYREGIDLIPIVARPPASERQTVGDLRDILVTSPATGDAVPLTQLASGLETVFEDARLSRSDRTPMIKLHADAREGLPSALLARTKAKIEEALGVDPEAYLGRDLGEDPYAGYTSTTIPIKYRDRIPLAGEAGYYLAWGGEAEDSADSQRKLAAYIPIFFGLMVLVVIGLFNAIRQPLIIWLTVPLSLIGVTAGLLLFNQPFGFMALLGLMSLSGMLIKNAIVLIDQINLEIREGKDPFSAVVDSGVSRSRPVLLAAATTILGMIPLLSDGFFVAMAVTIMFGLLIASLLTLVFVPVLYTVFFRIPSPAKG
jgi:multidrug efflux pump subunit AcrB